APEIDPDEIAHCPRIVERFLDRRVRQVEPLLQKVYSQHPLDPDWRTAVARLRIKRLDQPTQRRPRHYPLHLGQKRCPPRRLGIALKSRGRQRQLLHPPTLPPNPPRRHYTTITAAGFCRGSLGDVARLRLPRTASGIWREWGMKTSSSGQG